MCSGLSAVFFSKGNLIRWLLLQRGSNSKSELDLKRRMRGILPEETTLRLRIAPPGVEVRKEGDSLIGRVEVLDLTRRHSASGETLELAEMKTEAQV